MFVCVCGVLVFENQHFVELSVKVTSKDLTCVCVGACKCAHVCVCMYVVVSVCVLI